MHRCQHPPLSPVRTNTRILHPAYNLHPHPRLHPIPTASRLSTPPRTPQVRECDKLRDFGAKNRHVGATAMNQERAIPHQLHQPHQPYHLPT